MPRSLIWLFAIASGLSVANVYYAQPLLDILAGDFGISLAAIGGVMLATQFGCALAQLLLVPLSDGVDRHRLMAMQLLGLIVALVTVGMAQSALGLLAGWHGVYFCAAALIIVTTGESAASAASVRDVGAWVHVDGAFGLWTRASSLAHLTQGIVLADSWTTDAHQ